MEMSEKSILDLPNELFIVIFSFNATYNTYVSMRLSCSQIGCALSSTYTLSLLYQNIDREKKLSLLQNHLESKEMINVIRSIPDHSQVRRRIYFRLREKLFSLQIVYDLCKGDLLLLNEKIYEILGKCGMRERVKKKKFHRDRLFKVRMKLWTEKNCSGEVRKSSSLDVQMRGNDLISVCKSEHKNLLRKKEYKVECISKDNRIFMKKGGLVLPLPRNSFGKGIQKVEELVNIFLFKQKMGLFLTIYEWKRNDVHEIIDFSVKKRSKRSRVEKS